MDKLILRICILSFIFIGLIQSCFAFEQHKNKKVQRDSLNSVIKVSDIVYQTFPRWPNKHSTLDVYYKKDGKSNKPVLLWVHGGGWVKGDKSDHNFDQNNELINSFVNQGFVMAVVNYRLLNSMKNQKSSAKNNNQRADRRYCSSHQMDV